MPRRGERTPSPGPSPAHDLLARVVPRIRRARDLDTEAAERRRLERWHAQQRPGGTAATLPTLATPGLARRWHVARSGTAGTTTWTLTRRAPAPRPTRTLLHLHGGGYVAGIDPFHVRWGTRLADDLGARLVLPDHPLAPEHTWRDSHDTLVDLVAHWAERSPDGLVLSGDSAGGGLALAVAQSVRDRGLAAPSHLVLLSPWVDLRPEGFDADAVTDDPWLVPGKLRAYADWWAGTPADLTRPEVSPALGDLDGLPPTWMTCGTRDILWPGCATLARRAEGADWDLTWVEAPGLIHVYPLLPGVPEARRAHRQVLEHLGGARS